MNKKIIIMDYSDKRVAKNIPNFEDVVKINVKIITGDEILEVIYKNYKIEYFDSCNCRLTDYHDGSYCIYDTTKNINIINKWNTRTNSYDCSWK